MTRRTAWQLSEFLEEWAASAVATQQALDRHAEGDPAVARFRMDVFEADVELRMAVARSREFAVRVTPLNLGYRVARRQNESGTARLRFEIRRRPVITTQGA